MSNGRRATKVNPSRREFLKAATVGGAACAIQAWPVRAVAGLLDGSFVKNRVPIDRWANLPTSPLAARDDHTAVWTGTEMIIWGGSNGGGTSLSDAARFNVSNAVWSSVTTDGVLRSGHSAIWTGSKMIVWGGYSGAYLNSGCVYDPVLNTSTATQLSGAPQTRTFHTAVWTGTEMIVWGGYYSSVLSTGGRYNPASNTWTTVTSSGCPNSRFGHTAVWTGSKMIIYGGITSLTGSSVSSGGIYDPAGNTWTTLAASSTSRAFHVAVWTGTKMLVLGGLTGNSGSNSGLVSGEIYDPGGNSWTTIATPPFGAGYSAAVWTGSKLIVWGGSTLYSSSVDTANGAIYDPNTNTWKSTTTTNALSARDSHTAIWTGAQTIFWGGETAAGTVLSDGKIYG